MLLLRYLVLKGGEHWGVPNTAIPYEKLVNTEIPCRKWTKYRYRIYDRWRLLNIVSISRVFFFIRACIHQKWTSAFARKREKISNWSVQGLKSQVIGFLPILSQSNCQKLCIHLPLSLKSSKYWPTLDRRGQMNSTAIPWRIFFYRIPLARRMKNRTPRGWMIPQYRTLKSKLPKYRLKKCSLPQYRKPPCPPLKEKSDWNF